MNYSIGSYWRKWDLHVHTPATLVNNFYGTSEEAWEKFITDLESLPQEYKVLGINDYLFIDGYRRLKKEKEKNNRLTNIDLLLPVIELRLSKFGGTESKLSKANFHVIFSSEIDSDIIEDHFLRGLAGHYKLTPKYKKLEWKAHVTKESLEDLGRMIKQTVPQEKLEEYGNDFEEGFNNISFDEDNLLEILDSHYFEGKYLTAVGKTEWADIKWQGGSISDKKDIINKFDLVFISSYSIADFYSSKEKLTKSNVNDRLLDCSDAHYYSTSKEKDRIGNCFTWIKADTTFKGLQQVLNEFEERVFIVDCPPILEKVKNNKTKFIKSILIDKSRNYKLDEEWFDNVKINFNHELISVIGNKGGGKSALLDIIGLTSNSKNIQDFSFLNKNKFRDPKNNKSGHFYAQIEWESGNKSEEILLSDDPEKFDYEKIKYIPQNYLESLCNDRDDKFKNELEKVIFSHIPPEDLFECNSMDELISYKSESVLENIKLLKDDLKSLNNEIMNLEILETEEYKNMIIEKLNQKKTELDSHSSIKPKEIKKPEEREEFKKEFEELNSSIEETKQNLSSLEEELRKKLNEKTKINKQIFSLDKILERLDNFQLQYNNFKKALESVLKDFGIDINDIIKLEIKQEKIITQKNELSNQLSDIEKDLDPEDSNNLNKRIEKAKNDLTKLQEKLDQPNKLYQKYLTELEQWNKRKNEIEGTENEKGTIKFYQWILNYLENRQQTDLSNKRKERLNKVGQIFDKKTELVGIYESLYQPVKNFVSKHNVSKPENKVQFETSLILKEDFAERFFPFINRKVRGSFHGIDEGRKLLSMFLDSTDPNDKDSVLNFIKTIIKCLEFDTRPEQPEKNDIFQQISKENLIDFYNFLFSLDYIEPYFKLQLGNKDLSLLSPGEKGALILIFYLLIDKDDIPLVLDQPEENLDNQTVYELLVPYIKKAKARRQIIIATHNPNLAVVCDSEQVICANIDKKHKSKATFNSGAIENKEINDNIVRILEGTMPAFENRDSKYIRPL